MKPKLLSWNMRGLNEGDICLRVRNLPREWKVDMVCFLKTKLELMSLSVVCSLWVCHHVDWYCLDSRVALGGVLIIWGRRVVEKIDECGGAPCLLLLETFIISPGFLRVSMAIILIGDKGFFGMSWLVCSVGGTCLGAWG
jgi:hypothetical protein